MLWAMTRVLLKRFIRKSFFFSQEAFQYHYTILCPIELCSHYWKLRIEFCYPCECLDLLLWRELVLKVAPEGNLQNNMNVIWTWGNIDHHVFPINSQISWLQQVLCCVLWIGWFVSLDFDSFPHLPLASDRVSHSVPSLFIQMDPSVPWTLFFHSLGR